MVRNWLAIAVEYQLDLHEVLGLVLGVCIGLFYTDNRVVGSWDPECLQGALNVLIFLFRLYGLVENGTKSKSMTFQPVTLRSRMSE